MSYPTLQMGASGPAVAALQRALQQAGYSLAADGIFGPETKAMVLNLQRAARITADGIVGPATWTALESTLGMTLNIPLVSPPASAQGSATSAAPPKSGGSGVGAVVAVLAVLAVVGVVVGKVLLSDEAEPERKERRKK